MNESSLANDLDEALSCDNCGSADVENEDGKLVCRRCLLTVPLPREVQVQKPWAGTTWHLAFPNGAALRRHIEECEMRLEQL